jgi:kynurenine formamidase
MPSQRLEELLSLTRSARMFDLGMELFQGMPHFPTHPPFAFGLTKRHGEVVTALPDGRIASSSAESIAVGTHVGTHLDGLGHLSCDGMLFGGIPSEVQSHANGLSQLGVETVAPIFRQGYLLDIAKLEGVSVLPKDFTITPDHLQAACEAGKLEIGTGDIVLLRTGWARYWPDAAQYVMAGNGNVPTSPGPEIAAAKWLSSRGIFATGSDTVAYEKSPSSLPVHVHLLVEHGIHIIEALNLEELSESGVSRFLFVALPLKIRGATGSPIRPLAIAV